MTNQLHKIHCYDLKRQNYKKSLEKANKKEEMSS